MESINNELDEDDIKEIARSLSIGVKGVYVKDQLPKLENGNYVINLNGTSHWTGLIKDGDRYFYFDSFGFPAPAELENAIGKKGYQWNDKDIQDIDSSSCGYYVLAFFKFTNKEANKSLFEVFTAF